MTDNLRTITKIMPIAHVVGLVNMLTRNGMTAKNDSHNYVVSTPDGAIVAHAALTKGVGWQLAIDPKVIRVH